ncbi:lipocalin family protein [Lysobacter sp. GX 14042]|uniref:lipocalin family protein n=1 Tax=Lysobacter sp. GX 14042 TaxID=2907155 RepID=UPI001F3042D8|nr:lipocalin family protein [Lysobacter sp. GX 14042]MCE7031471.1 lipocalin family protein [Lysobacter sp. GX 14042]
MRHHDDPATAPSVDLERYLGTWYEIARLPMRHEPPDYRDITATYSLQDDGKVRVANRAINGDGERQESIGEATPVRGSHNSKLEVSFLPDGLRWIPFTRGDYWILRVDPDYRVALVGSPDRKYLWLLAREPRIDSATRLGFLATAQAQGFELDELIDTPQSGTTTNP